MPKSLNVDWALIELAYQRGEGSCRTLALKYGIKPVTVTKRCAREGWKRQLTEIVSRVSQKTVDVLARDKIKAIQELEDEVVPIARKLTKGVEVSYDSMHGEPIDSAHLNGLAQALFKANQIARLNLGAIDPGQRVDITTNGESLHQHAIDVLASCRKLVADKTIDVTTIDIKGLVSELNSQQTE